MDVKFEHRVEGLLLRIRLSREDADRLAAGRLVKGRPDVETDLVDVMTRYFESPGRNSKLARVEINVLQE